jgi:hypothetical protein
MATKGTDSGVYRVTEIIGTSNVSWRTQQRPLWKLQPSRCAICALPKSPSST